MIGHVLRLGIAVVMLGAVCVTAVADSSAEREGLAAIARDLDALSEAVRRLEMKSAGNASEGGARYRFDNLRIRLTEIEDSIRLYLREVESEPRRTWRVNVLDGTAERIEKLK